MVNYSIKNLAYIAKEIGNTKVDSRFLKRLGLAGLLLISGGLAAGCANRAVTNTAYISTNPTITQEYRTNVFQSKKNSQKNNPEYVVDEKTHHVKLPNNQEVDLPAINNFKDTRTLRYPDAGFARVESKNKKFYVPAAVNFKPNEKDVYLTKDVKKDAIETIVVEGMERGVRIKESQSGIVKEIMFGSMKEDGKVRLPGLGECYVIPFKGKVFKAEEGAEVISSTPVAIMQTKYFDSSKPNLVETAIFNDNGTNESGFKGPLRVLIESENYASPAKAEDSTPDDSKDSQKKKPITQLKYGSSDTENVVDSRARINSKKK